MRKIVSPQELISNSNSVGRDRAKKYLSSVRKIERVCGIKIYIKK